MFLRDLSEDDRRELLHLLALDRIGPNLAADIPIRDVNGAVQAVLVPLVRYSPLDPAQIKADHDRSKNSGPALTLQAARAANNIRAER